MHGKISNLHWYSDWNGYEVGYPEVPVVGLYHSASLSVSFYINTESNEVLEIITEDDEFI